MKFIRGVRVGLGSIGLVGAINWSVSEQTVGILAVGLSRVGLLMGTETKNFEDRA